MQDPDALLIGVVSRLTSQKGLDMLLAQLDELAARRHAARCHPGVRRSRRWSMLSSLRPRRISARVGCVIGYDEALAHLIQAGSDALLVPSRFEPCGLTQLCALRYGCDPVVSRVGGLGGHGDRRQ